MARHVVDRICDWHRRPARIPLELEDSYQLINYMNFCESYGAKYITYIQGPQACSRVIIVSGEANVCIFVLHEYLGCFQEHLDKMKLRIKESWTDVSLGPQSIVCAWRWSIRDDVLLRVSSVDYNTFMIVPSFFNTRSVAQSGTSISWNGSAITENGEVITL